MKEYGDSNENFRLFSIKEMEGENGQLHLSVLGGEFSQLPDVVGGCKKSSRYEDKQRIS